ncbi:transmembrane protein, putative (macronuclear) [Tetrahymena thermophila SB210]|uniref:Transmembrane protein, putative n=1 Tax=Tetrahymena thermophila (strain SB210) TaxID=312017 RepID=W7X5G7_TETTS|nr:transmembrane protein, putative [Tetrahymena thermophila SB210]EWS72637.1 transmembrane protein, putative [Tetrahymena thermophila SB210]|eukprot:XP_012654805.1 transmembrane protein, putative [Tetrahymena thermophila SB210]
MFIKCFFHQQMMKNLKTFHKLIKTFYCGLLFCMIYVRLVSLLLRVKTIVILLKVAMKPQRFSINQILLIQPKTNCRNGKLYLVKVIILAKKKKENFSITIRQQFKSNNFQTVSMEIVRQILKKKSFFQYSFIKVQA